MIDPFQTGITEWEFIASGEASESPHHQWRCSFYLGRSSDRKTYALKIIDFGDPDEEESKDAYEKVVTIIKNPETKDENQIVIELLKKYINNGGKYIEFYHDIGSFELDES